MSTYLADMMRREYPGATVERLPWKDSFRVSIEVDHKLVMADRARALREVHKALTPALATRKRRLHWGKRK